MIARNLTVGDLLRALQAFDPRLPVEVFVPSSGEDSEPAVEAFLYSDRFMVGGYRDHVVISASWEDDEPERPRGGGCPSAGGGG